MTTCCDNGTFLLLFCGLQELPEVWLVNVYTPNSGEGLKRLDYRIQQWDKALAGYVKVWQWLRHPPYLA